MLQENRSKCVELAIDMSMFPRVVDHIFTIHMILNHTIEPKQKPNNHFYTFN